MFEKYIFPTKTIPRCGSRSAVFALFDIVFEKQRLTQVGKIWIINITKKEITKVCFDVLFGEM